MKAIWAAALVLLSAGAVAAQELPSAADTRGILGKRGTGTAAAPQLSGLGNDPLRSTLSGFSGLKPQDDSTLKTRGAREVKIYRDIAPSVVMILVDRGKTGMGIGSGSLINPDGTILTNWHVVRGAKEVGVVLKPLLADQEAGERDMVRGTVLRYDAVADLALVKIDPPKNRKPIKLGDSKEIAIGEDVFAIGHPSGDQWTYTKGIVSQVRRDYQWLVSNNQHQAHVIQTQTPINPGNSGGPLLSAAGNLVGVNSFVSEGEGLNFAVSVDEINAFLARRGNREPVAEKEDPKVAAAKDDPRSKPKSDPKVDPRAAATECEPKILDKGRTSKEDASYEAIDLNCDGTTDAARYVPDDKKRPIQLAIDMNGDEEPDTYIFDNGRDGKWDISFWATKFDGEIDVVGYHPDGSSEPSSYENFQKFKARADARKAREKAAADR